jgi:hypothetical protein
MRQIKNKNLGAFPPKAGTGLSAPTPRAAALRGFRCNPSRGRTRKTTGHADEEERMKIGRAHV